MDIRRTVLLADANEEFRTLVRKIIDETEEFSVVGSVGDGTEALRLAREEAPDLILMDVVLPGLDGFGVLKQLREQEGKVPKVILISAFCSDSVVSEAVDLGASYFLTKPVEENALLDRMLRLTGYFSMLAGTLFWVWGRPLAQLLYHSPEAGFYLETLAPAMPLMYLESMVDGAMKGIGEQKAAFRYSVWDAVLRIGGVAVLLPRYGMRGFLTVILLSSFYTCAANTGRLLLSSGTGHAFRRWLGAPLLAAAAAGAAGRGVRRALTGFPAQGLWEQLAVLTVGGMVTALSLIHI